MDTLFSHVNIVTMNEQMTLWQDAFVGVTDGKIAYMAKKPPEEQPKKIIDATGMVLMPGLINCHTHLPMYLLRGYADDLNLQDWLERLYLPARRPARRPRASRPQRRWPSPSALRFGTTSVSDMYYFCDEICRGRGRVRHQGEYLPRHVHVPGRRFLLRYLPRLPRARGAEGQVA